MGRRIDPKAAKYLLGSAEIVDSVRREYPVQFETEKGWSFDVLVVANNEVLVCDQPRAITGLTRITVMFGKYDMAEMKPFNSRDLRFRYDVPLVMLAHSDFSHVLYNVRFMVDDEDARFDEETSRPLRVGYYGITGRHPMTRFKEHESDAAKGTGHLFHRAWNWLLINSVVAPPVFQICAVASNLKRIYKLEEEAVEMSLTPLGLNAIPGGEAGIKMLHSLRLLNSLKVSPMQRDAALVMLDSESHSVATHYRRAHFRKLPTGKITWVKACWVNQEPLAA